MSKTQEIHFKIEPTIKAKLVEAAALSGRSLSSYCTYYLLAVSELIKFGGTLEAERIIKGNGINN